MAKRKLVTFDWAMKRLLRSKVNFDILEGFLSELLHEEITILEVLESESNKERREDKFNRVDLKVRNSKDEIILIEIQYDREFDYLQRIVYGTAKAVTEHMAQGSPYAGVVKVISINILYFDLGVGADYIYHGRTRFTGLHDRDTLDLSEEQKRLYNRSSAGDLFPEYWLIKVNNFDDVARNTLDEWIYFLKNSEIKDGFSARGLQKAQQRLNVLALPDDEYQAWSSYQDDLHYQASMADTYHIGVMTGRQEMHDEMQEKVEEVRQEARERVEQIARTLLSTHDLATVATLTGLSEEELKALQQE